MNVMVRNMDKIEEEVSKEIRVVADDEEKLLYNFLDDIIFYKDSEQLLFCRFVIKVDKTSDGRLQLYCNAYGEKLNMKKHDLVVDVKAVTYHEFYVEKTEKGMWKAHVILDI